MLVARLLRIGGLVAAAALLALFVAYQAPPAAQAVFQDSDGDGAIDVAEEISRSDPNNANSIPEGRAAEFVSGLPLCSDGIDNDLDGMTDLDDLGCHDSDNDIFSDDLEQFVGSDPNSGSSTPEDSRVDVSAEFYGFPLHWCGDRVDNDGDGLADGDDPGCTPISNDNDAFDDATEKRFGSNPADANSVPEHELPNPGSCADGIDNDRDGMTDSADPACQTPANDDRADATVVTALPFTDGPVPMKNATLESGERGSSCNYFGVTGTIWYRYTPPADAVVIADTDGSTFGTAIGVWTSTGGRLQEIACDYGFPAPSPAGDARIAFRVSGGQTYFIQVDGSPGGVFNMIPTISFHLRAGTAPANDQIQDAANISSLPFSHSVNTESATGQPGEPRPFCAYDSSFSSVWYKFEPASDTLLVVDTEGSDFHAVIQAYASTKFGLAAIACATSTDLGVVPGPAIAPARTAFQAEGGSTYYLQLTGASFGISFGDLALHAGIGTPPPNDNFAAAHSIGSLPYSDTVDVLTATNEDGEPAPRCTYYETGPSVWYRYTAPASGGLLIDTEGSTFYQSFVAVYQGTSLDGLTQIACSDPYSYSYAEVGIQVTAGQTYYIQAGRFGSFIGPIFGLSGGIEPPLPIGAGSTLVLNVERLDIPACPTAQYTYDDPAGDLVNDFLPPGIARPDIDDVRIGTNGESLCLTIDFTAHVDPPSSVTSGGLYLAVSIDADADRQTGFGSENDYACGQPAFLGTELNLSTYGTAGILVRFYLPFEGPPPLPGGPDIPGEQYAFLLMQDRSAQLIVPMDAIGGDSTFNLALYAGTTDYGPSDCVPNGGHLACSGGSCHLFQENAGDANCDGAVNAIDAAVVLQVNAGLTLILPCRGLADANSNGFIGPVDAVLILQYSSGMLESLPVPI